LYNSVFADCESKGFAGQVSILTRGYYYRKNVGLLKSFVRVCTEGAKLQPYYTHNVRYFRGFLAL
jgi:hypothetical protein